MEYLALLIILLFLYFGIRWLIRSIDGYTKDNAFYDNTEIQYVRIGAYIKFNKVWFKVLNTTSRYSATMTIYLEEENTEKQKEIVVSPSYRVKYKVYQSV